MTEHIVRKTLRLRLLPYLVSAKRLRRQWFYQLHTVFGYTTDVTVALSAIGISLPFLTLAGALANTQEKLPSSSLADALHSAPPWLIFPATTVILLWLILRVAFIREHGQKRAVLAGSCFQQLREADASLHTILAEPNPMPELTKLLKKILPPVDRNIQDEVWPWTPFAPDIDDEVTRRLEELCALYESFWTPIESPEVQQRPER